MKKTIIFSLLLSGINCFAQDKLYKKDNTKLEVKIIEINQTEVKYKLFTYQDGPTIIVAKSDVALIEYQNGVHEVITTAPEQQPINVSQNPKDKKSKAEQEKAKNEAFQALTSTKNLISLNAMEPLNGCFGFSYLREFAHNNANIYIPVTVGFSSPTLNQAFDLSFNNINGNYISNYKFTRKTIEVGLGVNFQTSGKHAVTHFIGPYIGMAQYIGTFNENIYYNPPIGSATQTIEHGFVLNKYYFMLNNGVLFRVTKNFNIMMNVAIGVKTSEYIANDPNKFYPNHNGYTYSDNPFGVNAFKFGVHFGYRF